MPNGNLNGLGQLIGEMSGVGSLNGSLTGLGTLNGTMSQPSVTPVEPYEGSYEMTPRLYEQTLETRGKMMSDDMTIYEIPVTYTTNPTGSKTVVIG